MKNKFKNFIKRNTYVNTNEKNYKMNSYYKMLNNNAKYIKKKIDFTPEILVTLGSGLQDFANSIDIVGEIPYGELEDFPVSTVKSHDGRYIFGNLCGKKVICMKGRVHYYEGYDMHDCVAPIRLANLLGAKKALLTNAVGAINREYKVGDFMVCKDAITHFIESPLRGPNIYELGHRFIDTTYLYDREYIKLALKVAKENDITLHSGIQVQSKGPHFETPADIHMWDILDVDTVGMSSVNEALAARHMEMRTLHINFISNMAAGITNEALSDEEVQEAAFKASKNFKKLILALVSKM